MIEQVAKQSTKGLWPEDGLERVPSCPVCGSNQRSLLHAELTDRVFFCAPGKWALYECHDCQCAYLDPRPSRDTIHLAYRKYFTHSPADNDDMRARPVLQRLRRSMANGYRNWRDGTNRKPANCLGIAVAMIFPPLRQILDQDSRDLPAPKPGGRLLDVGCGSGEFMELAENAGWEVAGVDPDQAAVDLVISRGLNVRTGGAEAFENSPESFDVVTMSHVIEHVHDPYKTLRTIYQLIKPGGFLWLCTPNIQSFGHEYYGRNWRGLEPPRHLTLFNWQAIRALLLEAGFSSIQQNANNRVFATVAAASEAIAKEVDPYSFSKVYSLYFLKGVWLSMITPLQSFQTEFITLKAYKS